MSRTALQLAHRARKRLGADTGLDDVEDWVLHLREEDLRTLATAYLVHTIRKLNREAVHETEVTAIRPVVAAADIPVDMDAVQATVERMQHLHALVTESVRSYMLDLSMAWTPALLAERIAMPDGEQTTWGAATVAQHRRRAEMFEAQAEAGIDGAARHRLAMAELEATGSDNLNALVSVMGAWA